MADETSASEAVYVDAIFDIQLKVGFSGTEECWGQGYVIAENRDPQFSLMGIGSIDPEETFHLTWLEIKRLEGTLLYSGCPVDFGALATDELLPGRFHVGMLERLF